MPYIKYIILSVLIFLISGCVLTKSQVDPEVAFANSTESARQASELFATIKNGKSHHIIGYGSMLPTIQNEDYVVTIPIDTRRYNMFGRIIVYKTEGNAITTCHRVVGKDMLGYITRGDNNNQTDANVRINNENCVGEVIAIFRPPSK